MRERAEGSRTLEDRLLDELPRLGSFVRKLVRYSGCPNEVDDVVQEVAARALRYGTSFEVERELGPWLRKTALRVFLDRRERMRREPGQGSDAEVEDRADPANSFGALADREDVARLLEKLSSVEREVLTRFHQRGDSVREIAESLRLPEGTIKSHLHRARKKLAGNET
jgi:RNA polymerase sigma-70 factor (ECF subfamily)